MKEECKEQEYEKILQELFSLRANQHHKPDLEPMKKATALFKNPQEELKFIHITGTNGKGSTAAFTTEILKCAGKKVGTYTSPFLTDYRERITINNTYISKEKIMTFYKLIKEKTQENKIELSFFEISTLIALLYFKEQKVDHVVWEVGMGGSFDATKIANAKISCITNVSLEHTKILGKTKEKIAKDKCGIITEKARVFSAEKDPKIKKIIFEEARKKNAELSFLETVSEDVQLGLKGIHQRKNAAIAKAICEHVQIKKEHIEKGLSQTKWPGRLEYLEENILIDCAHNPEGIKSLSEYLKTEKEKGSYKKLYIIFGASKDKNIKKMLSLLPKHEELIFTQANYFRSQEIEEINDPQMINTKISRSYKALDYAKEKISEKDLLVICGSIFLVGEIVKEYQLGKSEICPCNFC